MHTIEPFFKWRDKYIASEDKKSPFYGRVYSEFTFSNRIYNYLIHPQWDEFGSSTLYTKILFVDYDAGYTIIELMGEWNDCLHNDIMFLKRELIDVMIKEGIQYFILNCDNVLNFHASDDSYYEEWYEDISDEGGWICMVNLLDHVVEEMQSERLQFFVNFGEQYNHIPWQGKKPKIYFEEIEHRLHHGVKQLGY